MRLFDIIDKSSDPKFTSGKIRNGSTYLVSHLLANDDDAKGERVTGEGDGEGRNAPEFRERQEDFERLRSTCVLTRANGHTPDQGYASTDDCRGSPGIPGKEAGPAPPRNRQRSPHHEASFKPGASSISNARPKNRFRSWRCWAETSDSESPMNGRRGLPSRNWKGSLHAKRILPLSASPK